MLFVVLFPYITANETNTLEAERLKVLDALKSFKSNTVGYFESYFLKYFIEVLGIFAQFKIFKMAAKCIKSSILIFLKTKYFDFDHSPI